VRVADQAATPTSAPVLARAAVSMSSATAPGCDTVTAWEAAISTAVAPARDAMNRDDSTGIARSWVAISDQVGIVFHAAFVACSKSAEDAMGRCVAAICVATSGATSSSRAACGASWSPRRAPASRCPL